MQVQYHDIAQVKFKCDPNSNQILILHYLFYFPEYHVATKFSQIYIILGNAVKIIGNEVRLPISVCVCVCGGGE